MKKFAVGFYVGGGEYMTYIRFKADSVVKSDYNKVLVNSEMEIEFGEVVENIEVESEKAEGMDSPLSHYETLKKLEIYRSAIDSIGTLGHIDIKGEFETAYNKCLRIACGAVKRAGDL